MANYIPRALEVEFRKASSDFPAILLTGARQVGKTTMLEKLMQKENAGREYISLDDLNLRELARNDPKTFFQIHKPPLFIDEVQYAPELFPYIKILVDKRKKPGDFWLTGSQVFTLMEGIQESLAGRVCVFGMSTLSQTEINGQPNRPFIPDIEMLKEKEKSLQAMEMPEIYRRIFNGGMPALLSGRFKDRAKVYSSYISTYIERDIRFLSGSVDSLKFLRFFKAMAALSGQMLNYKTISDLADISQVKAKEWTGILERLGIIFLLPPYSNNVLRRTVSTPKVYFYDCGLAAHMSNWSSAETLMDGAMSGAILENFAVSEIVKSWQNAGIEPAIYYYRDRDSKEIDIILELDGKLHPIEIKKTATPSERLTRVFSVIEKSPYTRGTGAVVCTSDRLGAFDAQNLIVPVWLL